RCRPRLRAGWVQPWVSERARGQPCAETDHIAPPGGSQGQIAPDASHRTIAPPFDRTHRLTDHLRTTDRARGLPGQPAGRFHQMLPYSGSIPSIVSNEPWALGCVFVVRLLPGNSRLLRHDHQPADPSSEPARTNSTAARKRARLRCDRVESGERIQPLSTM